MSQDISEQQAYDKMMEMRRGAVENRSILYHSVMWQVQRLWAKIRKNK